MVFTAPSRIFTTGIRLSVVCSSEHREFNTHPNTLFRTEGSTKAAFGRWGERGTNSQEKTGTVKPWFAPEAASVTRQTKTERQKKTHWSYCVKTKAGTSACTRNREFPNLCLCAALGRSEGEHEPSQGSPSPNTCVCSRSTFIHEFFYSADLSLAKVISELTKECKNRNLRYYLNLEIVFQNSSLPANSRAGIADLGLPHA